MRSSSRPRTLPAAYLAPTHPTPLVDLRLEDTKSGHTGATRVGGAAVPSGSPKGVHYEASPWGRMVWQVAHQGPASHECLPSRDRERPRPHRATVSHPSSHPSLCPDPVNATPPYVQVLEASPGATGPMRVRVGVRQLFPGLPMFCHPSMTHAVRHDAAPPPLVDSLIRHRHPGPRGWRRHAALRDHRGLRGTSARQAPRARGPRLVV